MRTLFYLGALIVTLALRPHQLSAQQTLPLIISGLTQDEAGNKLASVSVHLLTSPDSVVVASTLTDANGQFLLKTEMPEGTYLLKLTSIGYQTQWQGPFHINQQLTTIALEKVTLSAATKQLATIAVSARKPLIEQKMGMTVVNAESSITAAGSTVMELLEKSPGVMVDKDGNISIQGKAGVQVYIDGKATYLSNADLAAMLRNMQSDGVSSIELITAPSAKYDAAGNAGIINIRTKRARNLGTNGSVTVGVGHGKFNKANGGATLNYRSKSVNLFGNYNYQYNKKYKKLIIDRSAFLAGQLTDLNQYSFETDEYNYHNLKLGADFNMGRTAVLGVLFNGSQNRETQQTEGTTSIGRGSKVDSLLQFRNDGEPKIDNYSYNLNYKQTFDSGKQELTIDLDYGSFKNREQIRYQNFFFKADGSENKPLLLLRSNMPNTVTIKSAKADYAYNSLPNLKLEFGAKAVQVTTENGILFEEKVAAGWKVDPTRTNDFQYTENVLAAYVNGSQKLNKLQLQWGMRVEHTTSEGVSPTTNKTVKRRYTDYFPSVQMQYAFGKDQTLGLNYSKRTQRPNYQTLNPFIYFLDQYGYMVGNPYLNPQYMHGLEMTYVLKGRYVVQASASRTNNLISEVLLPDSANKAIYQTFENLARQDAYRLTFSAPFTITKCWRSNNNISGIHLHTRSQNLKGQDLDAGRFFVMANTNNSFQLGKGLTAELTGRYTSTLVYSTIQLQPVYLFDIGFAKTVLANKGTVRLSVVDAFNTLDQNVQSVYPGFKYDLFQKVESRIVRLGFTYRFGNSQVKASRTRTTGVEIEQNRLQKGVQ